MPLEEPAGGPNFFPFDPTVRYEINIDNNGDGKADVNYRFTFKTMREGEELRRHPDVPLQRRADHSLTDPNLLVEADATASGATTRRSPPDVPYSAGQHRTSLDAELRRRSRPRPSTTLGNGTKLFAGQRDDAFFVDLGSIFDLAGLRPFNAAACASRSPRPASTASAASTPTRSRSRSRSRTLTRDHALPTGPNDPDAVLGIWAAASRKKNRTLNADGTILAAARGSRSRASAIR